MPDWTLNQEITSSLLNQITAYTRFWASPPMFRMYQSVAQSIPNNAYTQIACDVSAYDTDSGRGGSSPWSYTIPVGMSGRWTFNLAAGFAGNVALWRAGLLYQNGVAVPASQIGGPPANNAANVSDLASRPQTIPCNAGDVMALYCYQSSGGALNTDTANGASYFEGRLISLATP